MFRNAESGEAPRDTRGYGPHLLVVVTVLAVGGVLMLGSASMVRAGVLTGDSFFFLKRQLASLALAFVVLLAAGRFDYRRLERWAVPMGALTLVMLVAVLVFGTTVNDSRRWFRFLGLSVQPSEFAKFSLMVVLAHLMARGPLRVGKFVHGILIPCAWIGAMTLGVLVEPDFGTAVQLAGAGWLLLFMRGADARWLVPGAIAGCLLLFVYLRSDGHRWARVEAWWDHDKYPELSRQYRESEAAFRLGGATGVGFNRSLQKQKYVPEVHTDFVYAVIGEERGLLGTGSVVLLFVAFIICGYRISCDAPDAFGRGLALGLTLIIGLQAFLNMYVVTGLVPTKGLALPFISYGGTNLMVTFLECGVLLSIARGARAPASAGASGGKIGAGRLSDLRRYGRGQAGLASFQGWRNVRADPPGAYRR